MVNDDGRPDMSVFEYFNMPPDVVAEVDQAMPKYMDAWEGILAQADDCYHRTGNATEIFATVAAGLIGWLKGAGVPQEVFEEKVEFGHMVYLLSAAAVRTMFIAHDDEDPNVTALFESLEDLDKE